MKIAVVGAGIFGATAAIKLAREGFAVELFEKEKDLLQAASGINQYRLHRGYHYPRSKSTALSAKYSEESFREEYGDAVMDQNEHYYCIAREGSMISHGDFLSFCRECDLEHEERELPHVHNQAVALTIKGKEAIYDPNKLREIVRKRLLDTGVKTYLDTGFSPADIGGYDLVVNCTYANLNKLLENFPAARRPYQFEVVEKLVLRLPDKFQGKSIVVLDGPFFCIDPYSDTDCHVMGNVVHAIHATNDGFFPEIPEELAPYLNRGVIKNPKITNFSKFIEAAAYFMPEIKKAEHVGSMYTVRTVLPNVHHTDERPTLVTRINDKVINIFSGKVGNCVEAAEQVVALVKERK